MFETVLSKDQLTQAQAQSQQSSGGGIGGLLAKKMIKKEEPKQRATIMTLHHEILEIATTVADTDLAVPADYKEKK
jgi:microsomal dipeptidase-like Zn-dependent dipeptidase